MNPVSSYRDKVGEFLAESNTTGCLVVDESLQITFANSFISNTFLSVSDTPCALHRLLTFDNYGQAVTQLRLFREIGSSKSGMWIAASEAGKKHYFSVELIWFDKENSDEVVVLLQEQKKDAVLQENHTHTDDLQETLERLSLAVNTARLGVWRLDLRTGETLWNDEMLKMYDLGREDFESDNTIYQNMIHPEDKERILNELQNIAIGKKVDWIEFRIIRPSGEVRYIRSAGAPVTDEKGQITATNGVNMDITDIKLSEKNLLDKSRQLQKITNKIPGVVLRYVLKPDGTDEIKYISDVVEEIYGITVDEALKDPGLIWGTILKEDLPAALESVQQSARDLTTWDHVFRAKNKKGKVRYLRGIGTPERLQDGAVQWDTITLNITEQVRKDQLLSEKKEELDRLTNQVPGIVYVYRLHPDGSDSFGYVNEGIHKLFDIARDEAQNDISLIWSSIHPDDVDHLQQSVMESAQDLTEWSCEYRIKTPTGNIRYIKASGTPVKLKDGTIEWYSIGLDITSRVEAEKKAIDYNNKLRALINASPIAIYLINEEGVIKDFWNPAAERIYGWKKEQVIGNKLPHINEQDWDEYDYIISEIRKKKISRQVSVSRNRADGSDLLLELTIGPVFDHEGNLTDMLVIGNDITELVNYRKSIEDSLKEKEILLMEIHHRVKNNLAIITGLFDLQIMKRQDLQANSILKDARNRVHSIAIVHEQLYQEMRLSYVNVQEYFEKLFKQLLNNQTSDEVQSKIDIDISKETLNINTAIPFGLLLTEVFMNSIKYAIIDNKLRIELQIREEDGRVMVRYKDHGPGFDQQMVREKKSLGWELIHTLTEQLDASCTIDSSDGFMLEMSFVE